MSANLSSAAARHDGRARLARLFGAEETGRSLSLSLHRHMAARACRLAVLRSNWRVRADDAATATIGGNGVGCAQ